MSEISRRIIFSYYPVWLCSSIIFCLVIKLLLWNPDISFAQDLLNSQLSFFFIYLIIFISLNVFKSKVFVNRLTIMIISGIIASVVFYFLNGAIYGFSPISFSGNIYSLQIFHLLLINAFFIVWFFFIAERSCASEKRLHEERIKRISNEKMVTENRLRLLQALVEPQFLFSTLASIVKLRETDPDKAKSMRMYFIQYLRATIAKTRVSTTTVRQEMELIKAYLDIFKVSMGKRLEYNISVGHNAKELPLPSMLIQPIVENAIRYGLETRPEGGSLIIRAEENDGLLHVEVADTGPGLSEHIDLGEGLSNVKERINSLFSDKGQIILKNNSPSGLKVIVEVPYA